MESLSQYLLSFTPTVPMLVIALIGIVLALRQRHSQPVASLFVIIGLVALFAHTLGTVLLHLSLNKPFDRYEDASVYAQHLSWVKLSLYGLNIVSVAFITAAVFARRKV
jgi:uncharacterized membrane protein